MIFIGEASQPDPAVELIKQRLSNVKHKILILSGKGGVGKSTVTSIIGHGLASMSPDINVSSLRDYWQIMRVLKKSVYNFLP